jgi:pimeloyl-ACP methyl ester carboxylesterase
MGAKIGNSGLFCPQASRISFAEPFRFPYFCRAMKKALLLSVFFCFSVVAASAQSLLSHERIATITRAQFDSILHAQHIPRRLAPVRFDVDVFEVDYATSWWDGTIVRASGLILLPKIGNEAMPLLAYGHGTRLMKERVWQMSGEEVVCAFFATDGFAVAMPDYIGLGRGERNHLYHHASTEAACMIDLLRAMKELNQKLGYRDNGQLFITGYSQGGHVAMATHRELQMHPELGFKVTASAPMSGAYDLAGVQSKVLGEPYEYPGYLPYLLFSFQAIYHLQPDSGSYFRAPYDSLLVPYYDGKHKLRDVNAVMPSVPAEVLRPEILEALKSDPDHPLQRAMKENTLIHWAPEAPMLLCYCKADEQVLYRNALVARDTMRALGSKVVRTRQASRRLGHSPCAIYTSMYTKLWFDSFRKGSTKGRLGSAWNRFLISVSKIFLKMPK